jgi:nucleotide-binding universal stress UspA family protein
MYKQILIATDGSELAGRAVTTGLILAKTLKARVTAVTVTEPWSAMVTGEPALVFPIDEYEKAAAENAARILSRVSTAAKDAGVECDTVHVNDFPAEGIVETAKAKACDLIVMASHGRRGLSKLLLGSQASRVLTLSEARCWFVDRPMESFRRESAEGHAVRRVPVVGAAWRPKRDARSCSGKRRPLRVFPADRGPQRTPSRRGDRCGRQRSCRDLLPCAACRGVRLALGLHGVIGSWAPRAAPRHRLARARS